jgi:hypothetical protein
MMDSPFMIGRLLSYTPNPCHGRLSGRNGGFFISQDPVKFVKFRAASGLREECHD